MAERDLPSRDSQSQTWWENVADNLDETGRSEAADVIRAWWSGRLVEKRRDNDPRNAPNEKGKEN